MSFKNVLIFKKKVVFYFFSVIILLYKLTVQIHEFRTNKAS